MFHIIYKHASSQKSLLDKHSELMNLKNILFLSLLASNELVFINFYADWCRFSNLLQPIFDQAAEDVCIQSNESPVQHKKKSELKL